MMSSFLHLSLSLYLLKERKKSTKIASLNFRVSKRLMFRVYKKQKEKHFLGDTVSLRDFSPTTITKERDETALLCLLLSKD